MKQAQKWHRSTMAMVKAEALATHKVTDDRDLVGKEKLSWMQDEELWKCFVDYWTLPHTMEVSASNKRSRATEGAGIHKLGRRGLKTRMRKRVSDRFCFCFLF